MSQVFRVERTKNYTVMANYHLKDKRLSLKAKGLLSVMLSLRERPLDQEEQPITLRTDSPGQENQLTGGANNGFPNTGNPNTIKD